MKHPTWAATVSAVRLVPPPYDAAAHLTVVAVIHEAVLHCAAAAADSSSDADGVGSIIAKFCPLMVTDAPPVCAAFAGLKLVKAGAAHTEQAILMLHVPRRTAAQAPVPSKLNCPVSVPTCFPTVIAVRLVPPRYNAGEHATAVTVDHEELVHSTDSSSDAEGVWSVEAKLCPSRVITDAPPVCAAFAGLMLLKAGAAHRAGDHGAARPTAHSRATARTVVAELPGVRPH